MGEGLGPTALGRPGAGDLALLALGVAAVSTSAPLIREAAAPALAIAVWRTALGSAALAPGALLRHRRELMGLSGRERTLSAGAGLLLAGHFAAWIPSLSFTSVSSAVALVATQPVWAALMARARGQVVPARAWAGIGAALVGTVGLAGVDLSASPGSLFGDALALTGGVLAAAYVTLGSQARQSLTTTTYATVCYAVAAAVLLAACLMGGVPLTGYSGRTWVVLAAITIGPQLLGHTVFNRVLRTTSPTVVSVAILLEVVGATALAAVLFGEHPHPAAYPAAALIVAGVLTVITASSPPARTGPAAATRAGSGQPSRAATSVHSAETFG